MKLVGSINHYRVDPSGWIGSIVMLSFSIFAFIRWQESGFIFFALLVLRDLAASWFLLTRRQAAKSVFGWQDSLAYISSGLPFLYFNEATPIVAWASTGSTILSIVGFTISTLALFELGESFGVSPANRGLVRSGVYRFFNHPMYTGYVVAELGFILLNPHNLLIFIFSISLYFLRSRMENLTLHHE